MDKVKGATAATVAGIKSIKWSEFKRNTILLAWTISGLIAFILPLALVTSEKKAFYKAIGYANEYEDEQRNYEEQQNQNDDGYQYSSYYKSCGWWNIVCKTKQMKYANMYGDDNQMDDDNNGYTFTIPTWFLLMGGQTEEMRRWEEENTGVRQEDDDLQTYAGETVFVVFMMLSFLVVWGMGIRAFYKSTDTSIVKFGLIFMLQMCIANLFLVPSLISTEDRMWEDSYYGWYAQTGVLMAYFDFWVAIFSIAFLIVLYIVDKKSSSEIEGTEEIQYYEAA